MSDTPNDQNAATAGNQQGAQQQGAPLVFSGQYIKDLSFEAPNAPEIFTRLSKAPDIPIQVDVQARRLQDNWFEVVLHFNVEGKVGEEKAFILELAYGAVVQVNPEQPEHTQPLLLIEAPRTMFPFARNIIADITRDGGFPPLMLQPIDFVQLYRQRLQHAQQTEGKQGSEQGGEGGQTH